MSDPYYRWFPGDYMRDTGTLTLLEHGAYRVLLDHYYCEEGLPSDENRLFLICKAKKRVEKSAIQYVVEKYFSTVDGKLVNPRADEEISERKAYLEKQRINGRLGGKPKHLPKPIPLANPTANPNLNLSSPLPLPLKKDQDLNPLARTRKKASGPVRGVTWGTDFNGKEMFLGITQEMIDGWGAAYPALDIKQQLCVMDEWYVSNPTKRKKNVYRFITNWLARHQEKGR